MRALAIPAVLLVLAVPAAAGERVLDLSRSLDGIAKVVVAAGVGEVQVTGDAPGDTLEARVELSPKSGFWGSRSRRAIERAELVATVKGDTLTLRVTPRESDHGFGEEWTIRLPARLAVSIDLGVGDVSVADTRGDIDVNLGVGDVRIESEHRAFGDIRASTGVGSATLRTPEGRESGEGFVGQSLRGRGPGGSVIKVSIGVGEAEIRLR
ncbi:MAG TPA: hypothetical protein P5234_11650 [Thermoanaerobaculaceae bacterium]|nr:hypothetical protein [Thermoanaerobaculaceae bacterium]HRS16886.1 hypothetical protein [Thermoanaerobaculaceae bacterium]